MKKTISALAVAMAMAAGAAQAADLPSRKGPPPVYLPPPPVFSWTGFYVGVNLGGGWRDTNNNNNNWAPFVDPATGAVLFVPSWNGGNNNSGGVVGGGQIGYNFQFSPWLVVGVETDFQGTSIGSGGNNNNWGWGLGLGLGNGGHEARLPWFGTVRGRLGVTPLDPHFLIYGTGGFAYGELQTTGIWNTFNRTGTGWTAGGGIEWAFLPNWSAKVEYLYTDLSNFQNNDSWGGCGGLFGQGCNRHYRFNTVRAGLNYHFNFSSPAPVVAKY
jgi:outer membrane immunogenic protein